MSKQIVVYDACVLYPAPLRDTLMSLALTGLFHARWTHEIHEEWIANLLRNRPDLLRERLERTRDQMNRAVRNSLITGYEDLINMLALPDPNDRHVLAAAIHADAQVILTFNTRDFPSNILSAYDIETCRPDAYVVGLLNNHALDVMTALKMQRQRLVNPAQSVDEFLDSLARQGLKRTVELIQPYASLL